MLRITAFIIASLLFLGCGAATNPKPPMPPGWEEIKAGEYFTFYLPKGMGMNLGGSPESAWGASYCSAEMSLYVEYSTWGGWISEEHASKQAEYRKERRIIGGRIGQIRSWRLGENDCGKEHYKYIAELILYDPGTRGKVATLSLLGQRPADVDFANQVFRSVYFEKPPGPPCVCYDAFN